MEKLNWIEPMITQHKNHYSESMFNASPLIHLSPMTAFGLIDIFLVETL